MITAGYILEAERKNTRKKKKAKERKNVKEKKKGTGHPINYFNFP